MTLFELNEKYKGFPTQTNEYEINGKKYIVHSHFVGDKNVDSVIYKIALNKAISETLATKSA